MKYICVSWCRLLLLERSSIASDSELRELLKKMFTRFKGPCTDKQVKGVCRITGVPGQLVNISLSERLLVFSVDR